MIEIAQVLQAEKPAGSAQVVFFIPALDRDGQAIDQQYWVNEGLRTLGQAFGGGTAFPPGKGVWRDDERGGQLLFEATVMILSFANPADLTETALLNLRGFLWRLGQAGRQGEVGVVIDGVYYGFTKYEE